MRLIATSVHTGMARAKPYDVHQLAQISAWNGSMSVDEVRSALENGKRVYTSMNFYALEVDHGNRRSEEDARGHGPSAPATGVR